MPNTVCEGTTVTKLFKMVTNHCPQANLATVQRKYFNEGKGLRRQAGMHTPSVDTLVHVTELSIIDKPFYSNFKAKNY